MSKDKDKACLDGIPFVSEVLARRKVARLEKATAKFRVKTSNALAKLSTTCAEHAELQARMLEARESVRGLPTQVREPLERRIDENQARVEAVMPACNVARPTSQAGEGAASDLSGVEEGP
jgi:hypothetical protein